MTIVPDRSTRLADGSRMVIDYKTGIPKLSQWFGDRPDEPQLPLYALAESDVAAVAFAQIRKGDARFPGIAAEAGDGARRRAGRRHEGRGGASDRGSDCSPSGAA